MGMFLDLIKEKETRPS